jgi:hypothetical protein
MWTSGEQDWTGQHPIPSKSQVYYWLRNSSQLLPAVLETKKALTKKQNHILRKEILKKLRVVLAARQHDYD